MSEYKQQGEPYQESAANINTHGDLDKSILITGLILSYWQYIELQLLPEPLFLDPN
jgi:hypothetical protein